MSSAFPLDNDFSGLPDLEFGSLPRTYSDQEITVINDASQLNFLSDGASIDGGYSSNSEGEEADIWGKPMRDKFQKVSLSPVHQAGATGGFAAQTAPMTAVSDAAQQPLTFGAASMGLNTSLQSYGSMGNMQTSSTSSPSKRMKRRLSNPSGLVQEIPMTQGMLRTSSVPEMTSSGMTQFSLMTNYGQGGRQQQQHQQQQLRPHQQQAPASSALPPLKEKPRKSTPRRITKKGKANASDEKNNRRHRHNESERVRMRTIAAKIAEMKQLMEDTGIVVPKEKAKILTGAVEYMKHLKNVAFQKNMQMSRMQETAAFHATPLPCCIMDATCNYLDSNPHFTRYFGQPHKAFPSAILLIPDWIYGRSVPQKVGLWLDLVQHLRTEHSRLHGMQLEDQCVRHSGKPVNFRIVATLINYNPSSSVKDTRILLTFFPMPAQAPVMTQLVAIKNYDVMHQQTSVHSGFRGNQASSASGASGRSPRSYGK